MEQIHDGQGLSAVLRAERMHIGPMHIRRRVEFAGKRRERLREGLDVAVRDHAVLECTQTAKSEGVKERLLRKAMRYQYGESRGYKSNMR